MVDLSFFLYFFLPIESIDYLFLEVLIFMEVTLI